jgi:hypothetical protein
VVLLDNVSLYNATFCCTVTVPVWQFHDKDRCQLSSCPASLQLHVESLPPETHYVFPIIQQLALGRKNVFASRKIRKFFVILFFLIFFVTMTFISFDEGLLHITLLRLYR